MLFLAFLSVLPLATGCSPTQMIATSDWLGRPTITFGDFMSRSALSPDGRLLAVTVVIRGIPGTTLVVLDVESSATRTFASPADEHWHGPTFSPDGNRIVFVRDCTGRCTRRPGHQISILDLKTGVDTIKTVEPGLYRRAPVVSPDGRFVAYGTRKCTSKDCAGRLDWSYWWGFFTNGIRILDLETGVEHPISFEGYGIGWSGPVEPEGFLDDKTLLIAARRPKGSSPLIGKIRRRAGKPASSNSNSGLEYYSPYVLSFEKPLASAPPFPRTESFDLLDADWVRPSHRLGVSSDTGTMLIRYAFGIYLGDATALRRVKSFRTSTYGATISKSGNRVAYFVKTGRLRRQLWIFDIATGKARRIRLRDRLRALNLAPGRSGT